MSADPRAERERAVAVINAAVTKRRRAGEGPGDDVIDALRGKGFSLLSTAELNRWSLEVALSRVRMKDLAEVAIRNATMRCLLVELRAHESGDVTLIVCDPIGDEDATIARLAQALGIATIAARKEDPGPCPAGIAERGGAP